MNSEISFHNKPGTERLYFADWLRVFGLLFLVPYHVGMYYSTWTWHIKSPHLRPEIEPLMRAFSPWGMSLLFLVSGIAIAASASSHSTSGRILLKKVARILVPLTFGILVLIPPQSYFEVIERFGYQGTLIEFLSLYYSGTANFCKVATNCLILPTWNHLWFLPYLFAYTAMWIAINSFAPRIWISIANAVGGSLKKSNLFTIPILLLALSRLFLRPIYPMTYALFDDWYAHFQYIIAFIVGSSLYLNREFLAAVTSKGYHAFFGWVAAYIIYEALRNSTLEATIYTDIALSLTYGTMQWCALVAAVGISSRYLRQGSARLSYLNRAVLPIYMMHQTCIIVLAYELRPLELNFPSEWMVITFGTIAISAVGFEIVKRIAILRPLFGIP